MAETYTCPVEECEHPPFKTKQALESHIRNIHPEGLEEKGKAREVPIVEEDFTTAELVRGKRYGHNEEGQLRCLRQISFEIVERV